MERDKQANDNFDPFHEFVIDTITQCALRGMQFPITVRCVCWNGATSTTRYELTGGVIASTVLDIQHKISECDELPAFGVLRDDFGNSASFTIEHDVAASQ